MNPRSIALAATLFALAAASSPALAADDAQDPVALEGDVGLQPDGAADVNLRLKFAPAAYTAAKSANAMAFLRDFRSSRAASSNIVQESAFAGWNDAQSALEVSFIESGATRAASLPDGRTQLFFEPGGGKQYEDDYQKPGPGGHLLHVFLFSEAGSLGERKYRGKVRVWLPHGAEEARWSDQTRTLSFVLPKPSATPEPPPDLPEPPTEPPAAATPPAATPPTATNPPPTARPPATPPPAGQPGTPPNDAAVWELYQSGLRYYNSGNIFRRDYYRLEAYDRFHRLVTQYPTHSLVDDCYWYMADVDIERGELSVALADLDASIKANPRTSFPIYWTRGAWLLKYRRNSEAVEALKRCLERPEESLYHPKARAWVVKLGG